MSKVRYFRQVDVFAAEPLLGNPVAVVHSADGMSDEDMLAMARWTNLSETTFIVAPIDPDADYRLRIFTPGGELPFAGHPTLGSAHAWLEAGGSPRRDVIVQECGIGLVELRHDSGRLAFEAPPLSRFGAVEPDTLEAVIEAVGISPEDVADSSWLVNGPEFVGLLLRDAAEVVAAQPDFGALSAIPGVQGVGLVGPYPEGSEDVEVRVFVPGMGIPEDPVTGSFNAGVARWLAGSVLPTTYVASQGTAIGRRGRVHVTTANDGRIWVGGDTVTTISGTVVI